MVKYSEDYLALGSNLDPEDYVFTTYTVETSDDIKNVAAAIAAEQSTGTWTQVSTLDKEIFDKYSGKVVDIDGEKIVVAFPVDDFSIDIGGVPQILSVIAGNLFGLSEAQGIRLEDVQFPNSVLKEFKGPKFGIDGLRDVLDRPEKPLVGTIVKPKIGLSPKQMADYVYECGIGGLTNGKDDETLSNQKFCPMEERVTEIAEAIDKVKSETGHKMIFAINISTRSDEIVEVAEIVQDLGATQLMIDVITCGFTSVQAVAEDPSIKLPLHIHRTMHGAMTRNPNHGISTKILSTLTRMCGGDALHIGTFGVGKMEGDSSGDIENMNECISDRLPYKPVMPVSSGGVYPGVVKKTVEISGNNVQIQAGGGVAGHPGGVRKGAAAMSQAVDAAYLGIELDEYAKTHEELKTALDKWGYLK
ncbi:MAG: ribulose 1,5-bisphosphate carboxylase large subunit [Methanosarcinaceae archaeon]|nr:ribulose 1,5-bisphosphate carboxylase large subunit [Methanosarcinaceae archaeon]